MTSFNKGRSSLVNQDEDDEAYTDIVGLYLHHYIQLCILFYDQFYEGRSSLVNQDEDDRRTLDAVSRLAAALQASTRLVTPL